MIPKKHTFFWFCNIVIPILLGTVIYLFWTNDTYISIIVRDYLHRIPLFDIPLFNKSSMLAAFIRNYFCDMCWAYAIIFCLVPIIGLSKKHIMLSTWIGIVFSIFMEVLQYFSVINGTFDIWDIILEVMACLIASLMIYTITWRKKK